MLLAKQISLEQLSAVDPDRECFIIKSVIAPPTCRAIVKFLDHFSSLAAPNERCGSENWWYDVSDRGNSFRSFMFYELGQVGSPDLLETYRTIFNLYRHFGEAGELEGFDQLISDSSFTTNYRTINPLVFSYPCGTSNFGWHRHDARNQRFQLLLNVTAPNRDYRGGETLVYMGDGRPELADDGYVCFGEEFSLGDIFSFPYDRWHKVNPTSQAGGAGKRVSVLMPLAVRNNPEYRNEYL